MKNQYIMRQENILGIHVFQMKMIYNNIIKVKS